MTTKYDNPSLLIMADEIAAKVKESDQLAGKSADLLFEAAKMVVEAKKRVDQGDAGDIDWYDWANEHTGLKNTRLDELHSIGSAKDPLARAREIRGLNKARAQRHRDKKKAIPLRNGEESKNEGSAVPAAETASGDPATDSAPKPQPEGNTMLSPETAGGETGHDPQSVPEEVRSRQSLSEEDRERRELISMFNEWALKASILDLRHEMSRIIDRMRIPANIDRRPNRDAA